MAAVGLTKWLRFTPFPWMGKVRYSSYLWHVPVIRRLAGLSDQAATAEGMDRWLDSPLKFLTASVPLD